MPMISNEELLAVYNAGFSHSHLTGLQAVYSKAAADTVTEIAQMQSQPVPAVTPMAPAGDVKWA